MANSDLNWNITLQVRAVDRWPTPTLTGISPFRCVLWIDGQLRPQLEYHPSGACCGSMANSDLNWNITLQVRAVDRWPTPTSTGISPFRCVLWIDGQLRSQLEYHPSGACCGSMANSDLNWNIT